MDRDVRGSTAQSTFSARTEIGAAMLVVDGSYDELVYCDTVTNDVGEADGCGSPLHDQSVRLSNWCPRVRPVAQIVDCCSDAADEAVAKS